MASVSPLLSALCTGGTAAAAPCGDAGSACTDGACGGEKSCCDVTAAQADADTSVSVAASVPASTTPVTRAHDSASLNF